MSEIYLNLFKAKENEYGIVYENGIFIPKEDFSFKAGHPYQLGLKKQTAESGKQYVSVRVVLNDWAIKNKPEFAHLLTTNEQKPKQTIDDDIGFD
jgi:predicted DNA-binding antitoxin AbrB/MazE fold protein